MTNMSVLANYQNYNKVRQKIKVQEMLALVNCPNFVIYLLILC